MMLPTGAEITAGFQDSRYLLRLRWRMVRTTKNRLLLIVGFVAFLFMLWATSNTGSLIRNFAEEGLGTAAGTYAVNYIIALERGELGLIGAAALGAALLAAIFGPFTGGTTTLFHEDDLSGLHPSRLHRYFDSLITTAVSSVGFLQLVALTAIGSLLTINGGRAEGILITWSIWPVLVLLTAAEEWAVELVHRTFGARTRKMLFSALLALVAVAITLDPNNGKTVFGVGDFFVAAVEGAAARDLGAVAVTAAVVVALSAVFLTLGLIACRAALAKPIGVDKVRLDRRRLIPQSSNPHIALQQMLIAQALRTSAIRRPLITILALGLPSTLLLDAETVVSIFVVALPLTVGLSMGVNIFGVIGPGMSWMASQPNLLRRLLAQVIIVQAIIITGLFLLVWTPATILGKVDPGYLAAVAAATYVSGIFTIRSGTHKSINRPFLARLIHRGDMIAPPLTTIGYTLRLALWSGQLGVLTMTQSGLIQLAIVMLATSIVIVRIYQLTQQWADRNVQTYVIRQVAAA